MKKAVISTLAATMIFAAVGTAGASAAPVETKKEEHKIHAKEHHYKAKEHKMRAKEHKAKEHKMHSKSIRPHSLPKSGYGGVSE